MGLTSKSSNGNYSPPNPDPRRFTITLASQIGEFAVVMANYNGCTTFEGNKVMVYHAPLSAIQSAISLDPHFTDSGLAPIARFRGDGDGWSLAVAFAEQVAAQIFIASTRMEL